MTVLSFILLCLAGGIGAALRFLVDEAVRRRWPHPLPLGTAFVNTSGSLLLGILTGLTSAVLPTAWLLVLGSGLLGGYTTFSTASIEAVRMLLARRYGHALFASLGMLLACVVATVLGLACGALVGGAAA